MEVQRRSLEATRFQVRETTRHSAKLRASRLFKTLNIKSLPSTSKGSWQKGRPRSSLIFFLFLFFPFLSTTKAKPSSMSLLWFSYNSRSLVCALEEEWDREVKKEGMWIKFGFAFFNVSFLRPFSLLCCRFVRLGFCLNTV